jgi:transcriptional regulator with XRE-family HTH domain
VPGLRREELAMLAGVSASYYARLEQGESPSASAEVLDALAGALLRCGVTRHARRQGLVVPCVTRYLFDFDAAAARLSMRTSGTARGRCA